MTCPYCGRSDTYTHIEETNNIRVIHCRDCGEMHGLKAEGVPA